MWQRPTGVPTTCLQSTHPFFLCDYSVPVCVHRLEKVLQHLCVLSKTNVKGLLQNGAEIIYFKRPSAIALRRLQVRIRAVDAIKELCYRDSKRSTIQTYTDERLGSAPLLLRTLPWPASRCVQLSIHRQSVQQVEPPKRGPKGRTQNKEWKTQYVGPNSVCRGREGQDDHVLGVKTLELEISEALTERQLGPQTKLGPPNLGP